MEMKERIPRQKLSWWFVNGEKWIEFHVKVSVVLSYKNKLPVASRDMCVLRWSRGWREGAVKQP